MMLSMMLLLYVMPWRVPKVLFGAHETMGVAASGERESARDRVWLPLEDAVVTDQTLDNLTY